MCVCVDACLESRNGYESLHSFPFRLYISSYSYSYCSTELRYSDTNYFTMERTLFSCTYRYFKITELEAEADFPEELSKFEEVCVREREAIFYFIGFNHCIYFYFYF